MTTDQTILTVALAAGSYLLGAIPFALVVARVFYGVDIRERGTGNVGAGNVRAVLGTRAGAIVMTCDMLKGLLPALAAALLLPEWPTALVAFLTVLGHQYSVFLRGSGGKGIATAAGAVLPLSPIVWAVTMVPWIVVVNVKRLRRAGPFVAGGTYLVSSFVVPGPAAYRVLAVAICVSVLVTFRSELQGRRGTRGTATDTNLGGGASGASVDGAGDAPRDGARTSGDQPSG